MDNKIIEQELLDILECPLCRSDLEVADGRLICSDFKCKHEFPIVEGIPLMLPQNSEKDLKLSKEKWDLEYEQFYKLADIDLNNDLELKDSLKYIKKFKEKNEGFFLEAGCGVSKISCSLAKNGVKTIGIDFSLNALCISKALFKREGVKGYFVCGDILKMPFKKNIFHFIYTGGVLEHFKNTQKATDEIYRCLDFGGVTLNTVPNISLSTPYRVLRWGNIPDIPVIKELIEFIEIAIFRKKFMRFGYEMSFSGKKMKKLFNNAGFQGVEIGFFETYYPLDWLKGEFFRKVLTEIANSRLFWPMIYILAKKT